MLVKIESKNKRFGFKMQSYAFILNYLNLFFTNFSFSTTQARFLCTKKGMHLAAHPTLSGLKRFSCLLHVNLLTVHNVDTLLEYVHTLTCNVVDHCVLQVA